MNDAPQPPATPSLADAIQREFDEREARLCWVCFGEDEDGERFEE